MIHFAPLYVRKALARNVYKHMTQDEAFTYIHTERRLDEADRSDLAHYGIRSADPVAMEPWDIMAAAIGIPESAERSADFLLPPL